MGSALPSADCSCAATVCNTLHQSYCCDVTWDLTCVEYAYRNCGTCSGSAVELSDAGLPASNVSIQQVSVGNGTGCAVDGDGGVWCWGGDVHNNVNDGTWPNQLPVYFPRKVPYVDSATEVTANEQQSCALRANGDLVCWGEDINAGTLLAPQVVLNNVVHVRSAGDGQDIALCAVKQDGSVWCWGQFGGGGPRDGVDATDGGFRAAPSMVTLPGTAVDVAVSTYNACALMSDTTVRCWGSSGESLGNWNPGPGYETNCLPVAWNNTANQDCLDPVSGVAALGMSSTNTCVALAWGDGGFSDGGSNVLCYGPDGYGNDDGYPKSFQTGPLSPPLPSPALGLALTDGLGGGPPATFALLADGEVYAWGLDNYGNTGTHDPATSAGTIPPTPVVGIANAVQLSYADTQEDGAAVTADGRVIVWGNSYLGLNLGVGYALGNSNGAIPPTELHFVATP